MKDSNKGVSLLCSFSWAAAIALVVLWAFSLIGSWGIGAAIMCMFLPYILVAMSTTLIGFGFISSRKNKGKKGK